MFRKTFAVAVLSLCAACSAAGPTTGEVITTTTDSTGLTITRAETREVLPNGVLAGTESELREIVAQVEGVDQKRRVISIRTADGELQNFALGKEVRNLPQVRAGDRIRLDYFESIAFEVRQPTKAELASSEEAVALLGRAGAGSKPAGLVAIGGTTVLTIDSINKDKQLITLRGPRGPITVKAKYPENLKYVKQGETVIVTVSELFAARVEPLS